MKKSKLKEDKKMKNNMTQDVKPKQWYRLPNGAEYSKDFKFFSEHQIRIVRTGTRHSFCSRLEAKTFKVINAINSKGTLMDSEIELTCKEIHKEIFEGKHGQGVLTD